MPIKPMELSADPEMIIRYGGVAELDATQERANQDLFLALWTGEILAIRVYNLISLPACRHIVERLLASPRIGEHADVDGLQVIGLSHFQAVRNHNLARRYHDEAKTSINALRELAHPFASPFDSAVAFLDQSWPKGCRIMTLPSEGLLAPFTIRIYKSGVGIEPHQDILSAESPSDPAAASIAQQFGANIYLSMGSAGGALELFDETYSDTGYRDLADGPHVVSRDRLAQPSLTMKPIVGDLILFSSRRVHAVSASEGDYPRITVSFFVGVQNAEFQLGIWA